MHRKTAEETLERHLFEMNTTIEELRRFAEENNWPTDRYRVMWALAEDLGVSS